MRISEEVKSEISVLKQDEVKDFIFWLVDFEKKIFGTSNPRYKNDIENKISSIIVKRIGNNEENQ